jgi:hypothetical protein
MFVRTRRAGVAVLVTLAASRSLTAQAATRLPDQRYTGEDTRTPLGHVGAAVLDARGTVYVLDQSNFVIHVAKGAVQLRLLSRKGRGPGEMQSARFMGWRGDSLWLTDASLARVTVFPLPTGRVRTEPLLPPNVRGFQSLLPVGYGASAAVYLGVNQDGDSRVTGVRNDVALFLSRPSRLDTVAVLSRTNTSLQVSVLLNGQPATLFADQPFALMPHWDVGRVNAGIAVVDLQTQSASTITLRVRQWSNDGTLTRTCGVVRPARPMTAAAFEAGVQSLGPPPSGREYVKPDWPAVRRAVTRPAWLPAVRGVRFASDGTIWLRTEASLLEATEEYVVLPSTGCGSPRTVRLPIGHLVQDARGPIVITSGFDDDVPVIDRWRYRSQ